MALNLPNFSSNPVDALGEYLKGYGASYAPQEMENKLESDELTQAIKQYQLDYAMPAEAANAGRGAGRYTGVAGEVKSIEDLLAQHGENSPIGQRLLQEIKNREDDRKSKIENQQSSRNLREWTSLPPPERADLLASIRGLGIPGLTSDVAVKHLARGGSLTELGKKHGFTDEELYKAEKAYAATPAIVKQILEGKGAEAEMKVITDYITPLLADYSQTFIDYSPKQILDSFKQDGASIEKQGKFLAARALAKEASAIRARLVGAGNSQGALKDLNTSSLFDTKILRPLVGPKVFAVMQKEMDRILSKAAHERFERMSGKTDSNKNNKNGNPQSESLAKSMINNGNGNGMVKIKLLNGDEYTIPVNEYDEDFWSIKGGTVVNSGK